VPEFYKQKPEVVLSGLKVKESEGLSADEVQARLGRYGHNVLEVGKKVNPFKLFFSQFNDILIIVLIIAAAVSFGLSLIEED